MDKEMSSQQSTGNSVSTKEENHHRNTDHVCQQHWPKHKRSGTLPWSILCFDQRQRGKKASTALVTLQVTGFTL